MENKQCLPSRIRHALHQISTAAQEAESGAASRGHPHRDSRNCCGRFRVNVQLPLKAAALHECKRKVTPDLDDTFSQFMLTLRILPVPVLPMLDKPTPSAVLQKIRKRVDQRGAAPEIYFRLFLVKH